MKLASDEVHLHFAWPDLITEPDLLRRYAALLSDDELKRKSRFHFGHHRHQYLVTRALIRTTLSTYYQVEPSEWKFTCDRYGKPEISYPAQNSPISFNLSHTNGLVMCGVVRDYDIGVDVEHLHNIPDPTYDSASHYFSTQEITDLLELPASVQKLRFLDYWTLKESYIKARGLGLTIPLHKFSFIFQKGRLTGFSTHPDLDDSAEDWQFWRISKDGGYRIAVATKSTDSDLTISAVNSVPLRDYESIPLEFL